MPRQRHVLAGGGTGTSSFIYNGGATAGSAALQTAIHDRIVRDVRSSYDAGWVDRGKRQANFGEVRLLSTMPGVLLELAFHDQPGSTDHRALHDPEFRRIAGRAIARGVLRYFAPGAPLQMLVATAPGCSALTVTPLPSSFFASQRVISTLPSFARA